MSCSQTATIMPAQRGYYNEGPLIAEHPPREQRSHTYPRQKQASEPARTLTMTRSSHKVVKDEVGGAAVEDQVESAEPSARSKTQNSTSKDSQKGRRKRNTRQQEEDDSACNGNLVVEEMDLQSKSQNTPSYKRNSSYSKRITEYFPMSETTKNRDDGDDDGNPTSTFIDSTLLDEALDAEDIAKSQSDLQDIDILSLSQSHGLLRHGSTEEDDERKRKRRKCSRLQDTIVKLMSKARQDLDHLDEKIKTLEAHYFSQPIDTTGLIKGWDSNFLNSINYNANNSKMRKGISPKTKQVITQSQALITEHIFSLTSSTCAISKALLHKQE